MRSSTVAIASPCHESWEAMQGAGARRFCGVCQKDVHDLSAMAQAEASALLAEHAGESLCVRYTSEADGTLRFRDLVPRASLTRKLVRTAFAAAALAACTPHSDAPVQGLGEAVIESIREATVPTADGGCDYTTGPFTTFHLPAGHALCKPAGPVAEEPAWPTIVDAAPVQEPAAPVIEAPPREKMGKAIAAPEPKDPFVPCDPQPGFAEPPPPAPQVDRPTEMPVKGRLKIRPKPQPEKPRRTMGVMMAPDDPLE